MQTYLNSLLVDKNPLIEFWLYSCPRSRVFYGSYKFAVISCLLPNQERITVIQLGLSLSQLLHWEGDTTGKMGDGGRAFHWG
jgi:hypothetical protein